MPDAEWQQFIDGSLSVVSQVSQFVGYVLEQETIYKTVDERALGRIVDTKTFIDGALANIDTLRNLSSVVQIDYQVNEDVLQFITTELQKHSPYKTGRYQKSHILFADGVQLDDMTMAPSASEFMFVNTTPYSVKIEAGESSMAPNGVYEVVAQIAKSKFPSARIEYFDYVGTFGVMAQIPNSSYGKHTTLQMNKSQNRFPAIRVVL
jgi:hypothetical protein